MLLCAGLRVRHSPGAIEDACEQLVRRKSRSTFQEMPRGLLLPMLVKSTGTEGLQMAMGWFWTERTLIYVGNDSNEVKKNLRQQVSAAPDS